MSGPALEDLAHDFVARLAAGATDQLDSLVGPDFEDHSFGGPLRGPAAIAALITRVQQALERPRVTVDDTIIGGERCAVRYRLSGRHRGPWAGQPASGRQVEWPGLSWLAARNGLLAAHWGSLGPASPAAATGLIAWDDFERVELRVGTVQEVQPFPEARKPAWKLRVSYGPAGERWSSAQLTTIYSAPDLLGRQVLGVLNFPRKKIGPFWSEALVTGFHREDGAVVLAVPDQAVPDGARLL